MKQALFLCILLFPNILAAQVQGIGVPHVDFGVVELGSVHDTIIIASYYPPRPDHSEIFASVKVLFDTESFSVYPSGVSVWYSPSIPVWGDSIHIHLHATKLGELRGYLSLSSGNGPNDYGGGNEMTAMSIDTNKSSVDSPLEESRVTLSPNPANNGTSLLLRKPIPTTVEVRVLDIFGRDVREAYRATCTGKLTVPLSTERLAAGIYWVIIRSGNSASNIRLIVQH